MQVLVLAAGYGTRLYALIKDKPKALLEVHGQSLLGHILNKIKEIKDIKNIILITNEKFYTTFEQWQSTFKNFPYPITIVNDGSTSAEDRLGSIGDIQFALEKNLVDQDLLVIGSDNLFDYSLNEYII